MGERYDTFTVAITAELYEDSLHESLLVAIHRAAERGDPEICEALGINEYDAFYGEDDPIPGTGLEGEDFAFAESDGYRIGQLKSGVKPDAQDDTCGGLRKPVRQVNNFEQALRQKDCAVTAKYCVTAQVDAGHVGDIEALFENERIEQCSVTCTVEAVELCEQAGEEAYEAFTSIYLKDGTPDEWPVRVRLVIRVRPGQVGTEEPIHTLTQRVWCSSPRLCSGTARPEPGSTAPP